MNPVGNAIPRITQFINQSVILSFGLRLFTTVITALIFFSVCFFVLQKSGWLLYAGTGFSFLLSFVMAPYG